MPPSSPAVEAVGAGGRPERRVGAYCARRRPASLPARLFRRVCCLAAVGAIVAPVTMGAARAVSHASYHVLVGAPQPSHAVAPGSEPASVGVVVRGSPACDGAAASSSAQSVGPMPTAGAGCVAFGLPQRAAPCPR